MNQLMLFGDDDQSSPSFDFGSKVRQVVIDGEAHFSILDILKHFGSAGSRDNPAKYWDRAKERMEKQGVEVIPGLVQLHKFPGQGQRPTPVVSEKGFLRIAQAIDIVEWEHIRQWMASVGAQVVKTGYVVTERADPDAVTDEAVGAATARYTKQGRDSAWIEARLKGIEARNFVTAAIVQTVVEAQASAKARGEVLAKFTNAEYVALFERTAGQLKAQSGQKISARDGMLRPALALIDFIESGVTAVLQERPEGVTVDELITLTGQIALMVKPAVMQFSTLLGADIATGRKLLA